MEHHAFPVEGELRPRETDISVNELGAFPSMEDMRIWVHKIFSLKTSVTN